MEGGDNLELQIEQLLNVEKQMRLAGDVAGTKKAATDILELCFEARAWKTLNEQILVLSKLRGQLKQAVTAMVEQAMQYIDRTPDLDTHIELIKTLNNVSAGKIYVEIERAGLIKKLAKIKEEQGLIAEAADLMQEITVETFGAMAKTENIAFILDQIMFVHKSLQGRSVQEFLMLILQNKRRSVRGVTMSWKKHQLIFLHSWS